MFKTRKENPRWSGGRPIVICFVCGKEFLGYSYRLSKFCSKQCCGKAKLGKPLDLSNRIEKYGKDHHSWKGDNAKIDAIHKWVYTKQGRPRKCKHCGKLNEKRNNRWYIHWANTDHKYRRVLSDYIPLCVVCHRKFDNSYLNLHPHLHSNHEPKCQKLKS